MFSILRLESKTVQKYCFFLTPTNIYPKKCYLM